MGVWCDDGCYQCDDEIEFMTHLGIDYTIVNGDLAEALQHLCGTLQEVTKEEKFSREK